MRGVRLIRAVVVIAGISAFLASTAAAALPELLPGKAGEAVTEKGGKATIEVKGGSKITCESTEIEKGQGEVLTTTTLLFRTVHFLKCLTSGLAINSAGDASGVILIHTEIVLGRRPGTLRPIIRFRGLPTKLEIPSTKLTLLIEGNVFAEVLPEKTKTKEFKLTMKEKEGVEEISEFEGGPKEIMTTSIDAGEAVQTGVELTEAALTFEKEAEIMN